MNCLIMKLHSRFLSFPKFTEQTKIQIKVCGITRVEDAIGVCQSGIDAIGLVFYGPSPRNLTCNQAKEIRELLPENVSAVAVVVDPPDHVLEKIVKKVKPDFVQFHGSESPTRCKDAGLPYIKAVRVQASSQMEQAVHDYAEASAVLLDTYDPKRIGGTGVAFSWDSVPNLKTPLILAGGLHAENVTDAIRLMQPCAVDVSTGVESFPGKKNVNAVQEFVQAVRKYEHAKNIAVA